MVLVVHLQTDSSEVCGIDSKPGTDQAWQFLNECLVLGVNHARPFHSRCVCLSRATAHGFAFLANAVVVDSSCHWVSPYVSPEVGSNCFSRICMVSISSLPMSESSVMPSRSRLSVWSSHHSCSSFLSPIDFMCFKQSST